ncbi:unnamed protein product (macronuclear) [Paramecium tetraurelia]|uniref:Uncharacterized protein n=1 Tax=Paramecium tetraurelia TaxID=5888 RepID=A0D7Y0_PARTE|nr:uncharacterized protein GSPATT00014114001 [Paramecium tetraurelia]CAK79147.1 unnamed protein product [Paramecium tetraurelia]|eukprot:XP_001446544.1 hypothetical protein (macronuclear) [Paramecium tetraurelia strain d4-2]
MRFKVYLCEITKRHDVFRTFNGKSKIEFLNKNIGRKFRQFNMHEFDQIEKSVEQQRTKGVMILQEILKKHECYFQNLKGNIQSIFMQMFFLNCVDSFYKEFQASSSLEYYKFNSIQQFQK